MQKYFPNNGLVLLKSWINGHFLNRDDGATREYVNEQDVTNLIPRRKEAWANASCNANTGDFTAYASDRIRTSSHEYGVRLTPGAEYVVSRYANPSTYAYEMVIYFYEENNAFIGAGKSYTAWIQEFPFRFIAPDNVHHCIIGIRHSDNSKISISEAVDHTLFRLWCPAVEDLATKEYVDAKISNGTRNLLINSSMANNLNGWGLNHSDRVRIVNEDGYNCLRISGSFEDVTLVDQEIVERMSKDTSTVYTLSAWVKTAEIVKGDTNFALNFYFDTYIDGDWIPTNRLGGSQSIFRENNNGWHKEYWVVSFNRIPTTCKCNLYMRDYTGDVFIRDVKLERGNFATAWTPAPEDMQPSIFDNNGNVQLSTENLQKLAEALKGYLA